MCRLGTPAAGARASLGPTLLCGPIFWPLADAPEVLRVLRDYAPQAPDELGMVLFARLAPPHLGATTVASWFLVIFSGSLSAGLVGTLWSSFSPAGYFLLLAAIAGLASILLRAIGTVADRATVDRKS